MFIFLLIGLVLTGTSVVLVLRSFGFGRAGSEGALARIAAYGFRERDAVPNQAPRRPVGNQLDALAGTIGDLLSRRTKRSGEAELRDALQAAGMYTTSPRKFMGYRLILGVALPLLWLWLSSSGGSPVQVFFGFFVAAVLGWRGPLIWVKRRARLRMEQIDYEIPELIDLLVTTVEAGMSFSASLQLATRRFKGPLGQELRLAIQEQEMGLATNDALENMLSRANTSAMRSFVRSVLQVETLGVSIGKVLRDLAIEMRKRRRQQAEERAQKAPTKMLFPLILLIFPAIFLVLLGPAAIEILKALNGIAA
ncbi:MAG TPA: type II secretion system F family protein [Gaiellaceae bacterium]|nr:type II secretion system F family protein [Gaiellaceae bacterium]